MPVGKTFWEVQNAILKDWGDYSLSLFSVQVFKCYLTDYSRSFFLSPFGKPAEHSSRSLPFSDVNNESIGSELIVEHFSPINCSQELFGAARCLMMKELARIFMNNLDSRSIFSGKLSGQVLPTGEMKLWISGSILDKQVAAESWFEWMFYCSQGDQYFRFRSCQ